MELVIFPVVYRKYDHLFVTCGLFAITGRVDEEFDNITITASNPGWIPYKPGVKVNNSYEQPSSQPFPLTSPCTR
jgi:hypothetical protein